MTEAAVLARKLQCKPGSHLWVWPAGAAQAESLLAGASLPQSDLADADVALLFVAGRSDVDAVFTAHRAALAEVRAVWVVYPKGNAADINRDTLWTRLTGFDWRPVAQVAYSETLSAVRARPLRADERVAT